MGTKYNPQHIDHEYAQIDGGLCDPGYLSGEYKGLKEPYTVLVDNTLTFYYDHMKNCREGEVFTIEPSYDGLPKWAEKWWLHAIVDKSFANYHPTSTAWWFAHGSPGKQTITITGLDNLATDQVVNMAGMFYACSVESLDVSHFDTSNVTNMEQMFQYCWKLSSLDVTNFDTSKVRGMGCMFMGCGVSTLDVTNFDTSNVIVMDCIFADCSHLTSIDVSKFNTSNVRRMSNMFSNCSSLKSIDVSNFDTSNVTSMYNMFSNCSSLKSIDVSNFDTSNVTSMPFMFDGCSSLTELDVRNFNTSKIEVMYHMFRNCSQLEYLDLSGFDTGNVVDMYCMFAGCEGLLELDLSSFNTMNVIDIDFMFHGCNSLKTIYVSEEWNMDKVKETAKDKDKNPTGGSVFGECDALVGGKGSKYDANHTDYTYARIDGGSSAPGYFTYKKGPVKKGDINGDGVVGQDDIDLIVEYILTGVKPKGFVFENADVNGDNKVDAADIVEIVNMINK